MSRKSLYLMWNFPYIWLVKVGISNKPATRRRNISKSMPGEAVTIFSLKVPAARQVEAFIHAVCTPLSMRWFGSGKSEWFLFPAAIIAIPVMVVACFLEVVLLASIVIILVHLYNHAL